MADKGRQFKVEFVAKSLGWDKASREAKAAVQSTASVAEKASDRIAKSQQVMERAAAGSAAKIEAARRRQADAAAKVEIAERKVMETVAKYGGMSSQAAAANDKLSQAMRSQTAAAGAVTRAVSVAESSQARLAKATEDAAAAARRADSPWTKFKGSLSGLETNADKALMRVEKGLISLSKAALAAGGVAAGAIGAGLLKTIDLAGRAEQSVGGVQAVFGKYSKTIVDESKKAANAFGLSTVSYQELATVIGAQLKNKGIKDYAEQTKKLVALGGDLAATYGGTAADAVEALSAAMRGESDPIERYGVSLNETAVNAVLAANGQSKLTGSALETAKAQARLKILTDQTKDAQGQASREHDTYAASLDRVKAKATDAATEIGKTLLPAADKFLTDVVEPQLPKIEEWGKQFGSGAEQFMQGMIDSKDGRVELTSDLNTWYDKGVLVRDVLAGIGTVAGTIGSITGADQKPQQRSFDFRPHFQGPNLPNWPRGNKLTWTEQKDQNRQWEEQYKNRYPNGVWAQWDKDFLDFGNRFNANMDAWLAGRVAAWNGFWTTVGSGAKASLDQLVLDWTSGYASLDAGFLAWGNQVNADMDAWWAGRVAAWSNFWATVGSGVTASLDQIGAGISWWFSDQGAKTQAALDGIGHAWDDRVATPWNSFWATTGAGWRDFTSSLVTNWNSAWGSMGNSVGRAFDGIPGAFSGAVSTATGWMNRLIDAYNGFANSLHLPTLPGINIDRGNIVNGVAESRPRADGGMNVSREPQIRNSPILWAEAGREAYIPLERNRPRALSLWQRVGRELGALTLADGRVFPLPAGSYTQTQGLHGVDGGFDYAVPVGTPVGANAAATVVQAADLGNRSYGRFVRLSNGSVYAHLSQLLVSPGQQVAAGQTIGLSGSTGHSTGPHLHYVPAGALGIAGAAASLGPTAASLMEAAIDRILGAQPSDPGGRLAWGAARKLGTGLVGKLGRGGMELQRRPDDVVTAALRVIRDARSGSAMVGAAAPGSLRAPVASSAGSGGPSVQEMARAFRSALDSADVVVVRKMDYSRMGAGV